MEWIGSQNEWVEMYWVEIERVGKQLTQNNEALKHPVIS
jgi:hypothetical protein